MPDHLHVDVRRLVADFLAATDADPALPIAGLLLVGSVALGDFRPGLSDVDFVAVTARALEAADLDALAAIHARLAADPGRPALDGFYVERSALLQPPQSGEIAPHHVDGRFERDRACFELNPATWQIVRTRGIAVRGPKPRDIRADAAALRRFAIDNLNGYWTDWIARCRAAWPHGAPMEIEGDVAAWGVLGVARLRYTLATGEIASKSAAGTWALATCRSRWQRIIASCLAARRRTPGEPCRLPPGALQEALAFMEAVIRDANALPLR